MIDTKTKYQHYKDEDRIALQIGTLSVSDKLRYFISPNYIWSFQKTLRKLEYYNNCKNYGLYKVYNYYLRYKYKKISLKLGFSIPINVFGPGLAIVHYGTIVVNENAKIGKNCRMHACVNIGASGGTKEAPQLGDNIYIAPGAKIYGNIKIANNIAIGANAVVNKSFDNEGVFITGNPATEIKAIDIKRIIKHI